MFANDDRDVKIFGKEQNSAVQGDNELLIRIEQQSLNGNLALAKKLGRELADELLSADFALRFCCDDGGDDISVSFQRRVLFAFCIEVGLDIYVSDSVISSEANSEFNRYLENEHPDFYKMVMDMGAFSLYYLSLRTQDRADVAIGEVFSKLCIGEADDGYTGLGRSLFTCFMNAIDEKIRTMGFIGLENDNEK